MRVCSFLCECILLYWKISHNFIKQVPVDSHTHALSMHGLFKVYNLCAFQMGMLPTWTKTMMPKRNSLGVMNVELSPVPVRHLFSPVISSGLSVDSSWCLQCQWDIYLAMNVELSPVLVRHLFSPVISCGLNVDTSWCLCSYYKQWSYLGLGFGCFKQMNIIFQNNLCDSLASFPISSHICFHRVIIIVIYIEMLAM